MNIILKVLLFPFRLVYKIETVIYNVLCDIITFPFYIGRKKKRKEDISDYNASLKKDEKVVVSLPNRVNMNMGGFEENSNSSKNSSNVDIPESKIIRKKEDVLNSITPKKEEVIPEVDQSIINQDIYGDGPKKKIVPKKVKQKKKILSKEEVRLEKQKKINKKLEKQRVILDFSTLDTRVNKKKIRYTYLVGDTDGNIIKGSFDAYSKVEVHSFLLSQGYEVYRIDEDKLANTFKLAEFTFGKKMKPKQLEFFLTQLSTYIKAGITLIDSVKILSKQTKKKSEKRIYERIIYELNTGLSFSEALIKQGEVFPKLLINMVKTAEMTGQLTEVLDDMADYYRTMDANRRQIITAMTYPSVIFVIAIAIITFIILFIVPEFVDIYATAGAELPGITLAIIDFSLFLKNNFIYILLGVLACILLFVFLYKRFKNFRYAVQWTMLHLPIVKTVIMDSEIIMFTKTFASLTNHDVFITDSMEILGKITNNEIYKSMIGDAIVNLKAGEGISVAFKNQWAFPSTAYEMMVTGEKTGRMGDMMQTVANYYQDHQKMIVSQLKSLIEPIMIVALAVIVGIILLSVVIPMFSIYDQVM